MQSLTALIALSTASSGALAPSSNPAPNAALAAANFIAVSNALSVSASGLCIQYSASVPVATASVLHVVRHDGTSPPEAAGAAGVRLNIAA